MRELGHFLSGIHQRKGAEFVGFKSELEVAKKGQMMIFFVLGLDIKMDTPGQFVYKRVRVIMPQQLIFLGCRKMMINYSKLKDLLGLNDTAKKVAAMPVIFPTFSNSLKVVCVIGKPYLKSGLSSLISFNCVLQAKGSFLKSN